MSELLCALDGLPFIENHDEIRSHLDHPTVMESMVYFRRLIRQIDPGRKDFLQTLLLNSTNIVISTAPFCELGEPTHPSTLGDALEQKHTNCFSLPQWTTLMIKQGEQEGLLDQNLLHFLLGVAASQDERQIHGVLVVQNGNKPEKFYTTHAVTGLSAKSGSVWTLCDVGDAMMVDIDVQGKPVFQIKKDKTLRHTRLHLLSIEQANDVNRIIQLLSIGLHDEGLALAQRLITSFDPNNPIYKYLIYRLPILRYRSD